MDEEYLMFADLDGMYPGNIVRSAQPADWSSLLQASIQRQRQQQQQEKEEQKKSKSLDSSSQKSMSSPLPSPRASSQPKKHHKHSPPTPTTTKPVLSSSIVVKIQTLLAEPTVRLDALKKLSWAGLPPEFRPACWKLLLDYAPKTAARRNDTIERKRREYREAVEQHYVPNHDAVDGNTSNNNNDSSSHMNDTNTHEGDGDDVNDNIGNNNNNDNDNSGRTTKGQRKTKTKSKNSGMMMKLAKGESLSNQLLHEDDIMMRQIAVDIPRTSPGQKLFQIPEVQHALQRVLYVWAMRHPASGYVQGMNDLVTPFMYVFLTEYVSPGHVTSVMHATDLESIFSGNNENKTNASALLADAEADAYWCLTALLNDIQDYYTFSQPGIQRRVHFLRELVSRVDAQLCSHLEEQGLDFLQFAFRWMNCLLMRELPFPLIVRVWDTYLAEADGFAVFHVYVCAALLVSFSEELMEMEFQELVMFLQNLPTQNWTEKNVDVILSQAYMWRTIFGQSPSHLQ